MLKKRERETGGWKTEHCFQKIWLKSYILVDHLCATEGNPGSSLSGAGELGGFFFLFVFFPLSPFLISTAVPAVVTPLRLLTDSSSGTLLRVIRSCHGHRDERVEKCALVAGHRGSQVDALTKLEEDTRRDPQVAPSCLQERPSCSRIWS